MPVTRNPVIRIGGAWWRGDIRLGFESGEAARHREPQRTGPIPERPADRARRVAVRRRELFHAPGRRIESIDAMTAADVNPSAEILRQGHGVITRQSLARPIADEPGPPGPGVVDANKSATGRGEPQPAGSINVDVHNRAERQSLVRREKGERVVRVAREAIVEAKPQCARRLFPERTRAVVAELGKPACVRQVANLPAARIPAAEAVR